ncbi:MAG: thioesterase family protein [Gammaproteobacteria bacterium]
MTDCDEVHPRDTARKVYRYWLTLSTRWGDNDVYGHVNNAVYFTYIDSVVNQFLIEGKALDIHHGEVIGLVVSSECQFFKPLAYPGEVNCGLRVQRIGTTSVTYDVGLYAAGDATPAAVGGFTHVYVDRLDRRPQPVPTVLRRALASLI